MTPKVIGIAGLKRSGKDTVASMLSQDLATKGLTTKVISFADPLKQILATTLGISVKELNALKNDPTKPHRAYIQRLGTEAIKPVFGYDIWVSLLETSIRKSSANIIIVPDFRFPVEARALDLTLKVNRNPVSSDTHISENALWDFHFDYTIDNYLDLPALRSAVTKFSKKILCSL